MDAHLFRLFAKIAAPKLQGAFVEKIQEIDDRLLCLTFFGNGKKIQMILQYERQKPFIYFDDIKLPAKKIPSAPIMRIRRYFNNRRIVSVISQFCQRKLWLCASAKQFDGDGKKNPDKSVWLCLDIIKGPMLYFFDPDQVPEEDMPMWPNADNLEKALDNWQDWPVLTPALRNTLNRLERPDQLALLCDLETAGGDIFFYKKQEQAGIINKISAWPLTQDLCKGLDESTSADIWAVFQTAGQHFVSDVFLAKDQSFEQQKKMQRRQKKLIANLEKDAQKLNKLAEQEKTALLLKENIWNLQADIHTDFVMLPTGEKIVLDKRFSILGNMERFFKNAKRGKRGLQILEKRKTELAGIAAVIPEKNNGCPDLKAHKDGDNKPVLMYNLPKNIQAFISSDGYLLLRGKDAKGNKAIRKIAFPHDLWTHVETGPGAHVIIHNNRPSIPVPERTLEEAGILAALKSWLSESGKACIMYAESRHVKNIRHDKEGKVSIDKVAMTRTVIIDKEIEKKLSGFIKAAG